MDKHLTLALAISARKKARATGCPQIENFRWHDLRHTFASRLVLASADLRTMQELDGTQDNLDDCALFALCVCPPTRSH
jgi:site-specific recombinase XerC